MTSKIKNSFKLLLYFLLVIISAESLAQDSKLKLIRDDDGIKIFKEKNAHNNINRIVVSSEVSANYMSIVCLIKDFRSHKDWMFANHGAYIIDSISPYEWIYYSISETPWPLVDRDVVSRVKLNIYPESKQVIIKSIGEPDLIPASQEMIRIPKLISQWTITKIDADHSMVELDILADAGGKVPQWIVNLFASSGPFRTIENMKLELQKDKYNKPDCGYKLLIQKF
ncbi:MAG: hypothetical protein GQ527_08440 [Bacteroidales bacterium]|nr:hypothetical protein [Bacteroidales bacterium]